MTETEEEQLAKLLAKVDEAWAGDKTKECLIAVLRRLKTDNDELDIYLAKYAALLWTLHQRSIDEIHSAETLYGPGQPQ